MAAIPESYRETIEPLVAKARGFLEEGQKLAALAFVGSFTTRRIEAVLLDTSSDDAKDRSATEIQRAAAALEADFVFLVMEAWGLPKDKLSSHQKILDKYGSIANSPYRIDTVSLVLETHYGIWSAQVLIKPKGYSKKKRTFGEVQFLKIDGAQGRFSALLPGAKDGESRPLQ
ncbi:MAG: hypothetical protein ACKVQK_15100 [Burkholderiales bacterium]